MTNNIPINTDRLNELAFVVTLLFGALIVGLSLTFLGVGVTLTAESPSPYMETMWERNLLLTLNVFSFAAGLLVMRFAFKWIGW